MNSQNVLNLPDYYHNQTPNLIKQAEFDLSEHKNIAYIFIGNAGSGKTLLSNLISQARMNIDYKDAQSIYSRYLELVSSNFTDKNEAINKLENCLCSNIRLDDLGCEKETESSKEFFETILNNMYNKWKAGKITFFIITTNLSMALIQKRYGDRAYSRLMEMFTVWQFPNVDYRQIYSNVRKA